MIFDNDDNYMAGNTHVVPIITEVKDVNFDDESLETLKHVIKNSRVVAKRSRKLERTPVRLTLRFDAIAIPNKREHLLEHFVDKRLHLRREYLLSALTVAKLLQHR